MEIILKQDIDTLGYQYDVVDVKPGYARNYLIPKGLAMTASASNKKMVEEILRQQSQKAAKVKAVAEEKARQIGDEVIRIETKAGESGKIFGSVTPLQIADVIEKRGVEVNRKKIKIMGDIKMLGTYTAVVELHKLVKHEVTIEVVSEDAKPAAATEEAKEVEA
ncbi:MAG: 50S ribosomal protein L9 [Bacteroidota bacterium]